MATTSYFSFTNDERKMISKMLQLSSNQYAYLEKELDSLLDSCKMCEDHQLPYKFYNDQKFFCPKCLDQEKPKNFHYIEENDQDLINKLEQQLKQYENFKIPQIDFETKTNLVRSQQLQANESIDYGKINKEYMIKNQNNLNNYNSCVLKREQNQNYSEPEEIGNMQQLKETLQKRRKFLEVQEFISHIQIENNRRAHDEMHNTDVFMRPTFQWEQQQDNTEAFTQILKQFLGGQQ
ncbi:unnamed protein product [Paramecium sonneborni]|uniref:Uncharacterized protein n=1 Tax=Paramecium sonneborni TaxID=65129 RepID=A0A8S1Q3E9_9CILI|nr:unnamed protein product [Paramecium sonneborni]